MKLSQDAETALDKLPPEQQQKVIRLAAQRLAINELKRRVEAQNSASKGNPMQSETPKMQQNDSSLSGGR